MPRTRLILAALLAALFSLSLATSPVAAAGLPTVVRHVATQDKVIALTFDDGWSPSRALQIVAMLDQYGATGTFFPYANAAAGAPGTWRTIAKRFPIGNHTTTHPNMTKLSPDRMFWEIDNARQVIEGIIGRPMISMFRPPYMFYNQTVEQEAYRAGFKYMALWSVDSGDSLASLEKNDEQVYSRAIQGQPGGIVLFHAGPAVTVRVLPRVLEYYKSHGFKFVTLPQLIGFPWSPDTTGVSGPPAPPPTAAGPTVCVCPDEAQLYWTGPVYVRASTIFGAARE